MRVVGSLKTANFAFPACDIDVFMSIFAIPYELAQHEEVKEDRTGTAN